MKRKLLIAVAFLATMTAAAQNIAAVSPSNTTTIYQTLEEAIVGAESGSTIYLPGGGFQIKDETKINKKLTIMGVSHRGDTDNVDGATIISGNLHFEGGSSGSAVLGVYLTGDINVGTETDSVTNFTVRYCNVNSIQVKHSQSSGMVVNQCYLRQTSNFRWASVNISNSISDKLFNINGGVIKNNIVMDRDYRYYAFSDKGHAFDHVDNATIIYNIILSERVHRGSNNQDYKNLAVFSQWGNDPIEIDAINTEDIFIKDKGVSPFSNFHFKNEYKQYESQVGIYGGTGFKDEALAPIPRIVSKKVDESTDGSGKLQIEVTVKAQ